MHLVFFSHFRVAVAVADAKEDNPACVMSSCCKRLRACCPLAVLIIIIDEHKRAKRWTALLFSSSKPKPSELQLQKGALLRRTPRPCLAQAPLPLPISLASRISAAAPFFKSPLAGPLV